MEVNFISRLLNVAGCAIVQLPSLLCFTYEYFMKHSRTKKEARLSSTTRNGNPENVYGSSINLGNSTNSNGSQTTDLLTQTIPTPTKQEELLQNLIQQIETLSRRTERIEQQHDRI